MKIFLLLYKLINHQKTLCNEKSCEQKNAVLLELDRSVHRISAELSVDVIMVLEKRIYILIIKINV